MIRFWSPEYEYLFLYQDPYASNWLERLRAIKRLKGKVKRTASNAMLLLGHWFGGRGWTNEVLNTMIVSVPRPQVIREQVEEDSSGQLHDFTGHQITYHWCCRHLAVHIVIAFRLDIFVFRLCVSAEQGENKYIVYLWLWSDADILFHIYFDNACLPCELFFL